jgi:hypothetical protein
MIIEHMIAIFLDPEFPLEDARIIGEQLTQSEALIPGYIPAQAGFLSIEAIKFQETVDKIETTLLPDRNLITRMARIAKDGVSRPIDDPTKIAASLMAFAQTMNFDIDPSIAFHELASRQGNDLAHEELKWFRAADEAQPLAWIDIALGRSDRLNAVSIPDVQSHDLARPIGRWRRNYVVALKIAELELSNLSNLDRLLTLFRWMIDDFIWAGPAAIFATMYYSPIAARSGMLKHLRSPNRLRAIAGIKNAAWDITYLSEFARHVSEAKNSKKWFVLATADKALAQLAPLLIVDAEMDERSTVFAREFSRWWPHEVANEISNTLVDHLQLVEHRDPPGSAQLYNPIQNFTTSGEAQIKAWTPSG